MAWMGVFFPQKPMQQDVVDESISQEILDSICPGLVLLPEFCTEAEERAVLNELDVPGAWDERLSRRVQHFGYEFDYKHRKTLEGYPLVPFPQETSKLLARICDQVEQVSSKFNQLTVNEYFPGQGISNHIDTHSCLGDVILSVSLLSDIAIRFTPASAFAPPESKRFAVMLKRRSVLVMTGPSRFAFKHGIQARKTDLLNSGQVVRRSRRVSLTFRTIREPPCTCSWPDACDSQELQLEETRISERAPLGAVERSD